MKGWVLVAETQMEFQIPTVVPRKGRLGREGRLLAGEPHLWDPAQASIHCWLGYHMT